MKQTKIVTGLMMASLIGLSSACVTLGNNFSSDYSWIRPNKTTQSEVFKVLGEPSHTGHSSGMKTWTYGFYKLRLIGGKHTKELKIYWTKNVVDSFSFNSSFPEDKQKALSTIPKK